ncbi:hypothetical protein [Bradyrhizobium genosp. P]|uniref:hypothetical protein n=1 Tax=Bradyrhizobium genosp. P TaxID=83641 RepID=UPI003CEB65F5
MRHADKPDDAPATTGDRKAFKEPRARFLDSNVVGFAVISRRHGGARSWPQLGPKILTSLEADRHRHQRLSLGAHWISQGTGCTMAKNRLSGAAGLTIRNWAGAVLATLCLQTHRDQLHLIQG